MNIEDKDEDTIEYLLRLWSGHRLTNGPGPYKRAIIGSRHIERLVQSLGTNEAPTKLFGMSVRIDWVSPTRVWFE